MILIVTPVNITPPNEGNKLRIHAFVNELKNEGKKFHLVYVGYIDKDTALMKEEWGSENVSLIAWKYPYKYLIKFKIKNFFKSLGLFEKWSLNQDIDDFENCNTLKSFKKLVDKINPKIILIEYAYLSWLSKVVNSSITLIIDTHDVLTDRNWKTKLQGFEGNWVSMSKNDERKALQRASKIIAIQNNEAEFFRKDLKLTNQIEVIGHLARPFNYSVPNLPNIIGYLASSNRNNIQSLSWFLDNVWGELIEINPRLELHIAGTICNTFTNKFKNVSLIGPLQDVSLFYSSCSFMINPIYAGTGLKIKSVEALLHGRAVIGSTKAAEGLEFFINYGLHVYNTKEEMLQMILYMSKSIEACRNESILAFGRAETYYINNKNAFLEFVK